MSAGEKVDQLAQLREALVTIRELRRRLEEAEDGRRDPIAVVGLACTFPGAPSAEAFWELLADGVDAVTPVPADRWDADAIYDPDPLAPGTAATRWGGFLAGVDLFDAGFFGISPREAGRMDPQQRLLLEVAYEALEDAGIPLGRARGSLTGVFVGLHNYSNDYALLQLADPGAIDTYTGTGTAQSIAANRLSYVFDLQGPSLAVDTACSSSLVAVHLAVQSLRARECDGALAGGVNLMLAPESTIAFSRMQMLAADGRCKTFDARADGFVRGEGCGLVVLKRLADALADGDPIHAVIRGSAVNQDGATNGLTAPNGLSQQRVIRQALANAGVAPERVGYVETHGTGTALGDPIEVEALADALGRRPGAACALGAVKTNVGHLEAAAGIASLIKAVLALERGVIPPNLHFAELNPHIAALGAAFAFPTEPVPWPAGEEPRCAGVSSFGWGGTNAHVVLAEAPARGPVGPGGTEPEGACLLPLSTRDSDALRSRAEGFRSLLETAAPPLRDVCYTAGVRRTHHEHRLAVTGASREELARRLDEYLAGEQAPGVAAGRAPEHRPGLVLVFSGQGPQSSGMGRELLEREPVFRGTIERCDELLRRHAGWSLLEELRADADASHLDRTDVNQPVTFALQVALAELFRSWGIVPDAVVGHSAGETAAAWAAGVLSLEDAVLVAFERGRVQQRACGRGKMAATELPAEEAARAIAPYGDRLAVAAVNSSTSTTLSGDPEAVEEVVAALKERGFFARVLQVDFASHSPAMDPLRRELERALQGVRPRPASIPIVSTVTAEPAAPSDYGAAYWGRNIREPVRFADAVAPLAARGHGCFLELSPHPVLGAAVARVLEDAGAQGSVLASLRRGQEEQASLLGVLGELWVRGFEVAWERLQPGGGRVVELPAYPFRRERHWIGEAARSRPRGRAGHRHPLLGEGERSPLHPGRAFAVDLAGEADLLSEHRLGGAAAVPLAVLLELALAAGAGWLGDGVRTVEGVIVHRPLLLPPEGDPPEAELVLEAGGDGAAWRLFSLDEDGESWTLHAEGLVRPGGPDAAPLLPAEVRARCPADVPGERFYRDLSARGFELGPAFRGVERLSVGEDEALCEIRLPAAARRSAYRLHPLLLDAALQATAALWPPADGGRDRAYLPVSLDRLVLHGTPGERLVVHARRRASAGAEGIALDVTLHGDGGEPVASVEGLVARAIDPADVARGVGEAWREWLYEVEWRPRAEAPRAAPSRGGWLLVGGGPTAERLQGLLEAAGDHVARARDTEEAAALLAGGANGDSPWRVAVDLQALDAAVLPAAGPAEVERATAALCGGALRLVRALDAAGGAPPRLWIATRGGQPAGGGPVDPVQASLWGLGRTIAVERPELFGGLVDVEGDAEARAEALVTVRSAGDEPELAVRSGEALVPRLTRRRWLPPGSVSWRPDATYLVTGGLGGLGLEVARLAAERGARHLVLTGRRPQPPREAWASLPEGSEEARRARGIEAVETLGATVRAVACDVADPAAVAELLAGIEREGPPLRGVLHAAAVIEARPLDGLDGDVVLATLRPKATGAWVLHELTRGLDLDLFVLFSSTTALWGSRGLAHYAAANAFLDALAHERRRLSLPALSVDWGIWEEMRLFSAEERQAVVEAGLVPMSAEEAFAAIGRLAAAGLPQAAVAAVDWDVLKPLYEAKRARPLLAEVGARADAQRAAAGGGGPLAARLETAPAHERRGILFEHVRAAVASVLGVQPPESLDPGEGFFRMGMDSMTSIELKARLEASLGRPFPPSLAFNYPSVEALTGHLVDELGLPAARAPALAGAAEAETGYADLSDDDLVALLAKRLEEIR